MRVAVDSLGLFGRLASEGAEHAADALTELTGVELVVDVTDVALLTREDLRAAFADRDHVGVRIGLEGGLAGETVLAFRRESVGVLLSTLLPDHDPDEPLARSGVKELGNIAIGGFVDGWATHLGAGIDITPPEYVEAEGADVLPAHAVGGDSVAFVFQSQLRARGADVDVALYMLPEYEAFSELLADRRGADGPALPLDGLTTFDRMAREGASAAAENLTAMTGVETGVEVSQLRFLPIEDVAAHVGDEVVAGTVFELSGGLDGYLAILFSEGSALTVADAMMPTDVDDEIDDMAASALSEVGNVMTSGVVDGWADVLGTGIDHSPPEFVHDMGTAAVEPVLGRLATEQDHAFVVDSTVRTADRAVACDVYALPDERDLTTVLQELSDAGDPVDVGRAQ